MSDATHPTGAGLPVDSDHKVPRQGRDDTREPYPVENPANNLNLVVCDKTSMAEALAAIRAMERTPEAPPPPPPPGVEVKDVFGKHDWENIDLAAEFGLTITEDKLKVEKIPGDDGKTYSMEIDTKDGKLSVWEVDEQGNKTKVEDPVIMLEILQKGKYLEAIQKGKDYIQNLNLTPEQSGALDSLIDGIKDKDPQAVKDAVAAYLKAGGDPSALFHAIGTLLLLRQVEGTVVGVHRVEGNDSLWIGFGEGAEQPDVVIDLPRQFQA